MKVTFVALGYEQLSVGLLAALARRHGHQVGLAFSAALFDDRYQLRVPLLAGLLDDRRRVLDDIVAQAPDLLAFSALTNLYPWMVELARDARRALPAVRVLFGGCHPTAVPDHVLASGVVDYVCVGEGDQAFPELLAAIAAGGPARPIGNLRFHAPDGRAVRGPQRDHFADLDSLPFFDKQIWEDHLRVGDHYMTMSSRGCPFRCSFCFNDLQARLPDSGSAAGYVRRRSVDHVIGELVAARRRYRLRFVDFEDDIFTLDRGWLRRFLDRYRREVARPFQCLTHARFIDAEIAGWLRAAGCEWIQMGVQSADEEYKAATLFRREDNDQVARAIDAINGSGIRLKIDHIFGLPGEPAAAQDRARALYAAHTPARIDTFWATYFPGTRLVDHAQRLGLLDDDAVRALAGGHGRGYHAGGHVAAAELRRLAGYELLFAALPLLPRRLRARLSPGALSHLPRLASGALRLAVDLANATRTGSNEHYAYAAHYLYHLECHLARSVGLPPPRLPAGRPDQ